MKTAIVYAKVRLEVLYEDKDHLGEILDDMDYNFSFKEHGEELVKDTELDAYEDKNGEFICDSKEYD